MTTTTTDEIGPLVAEVQEFKHGLGATFRCDRCGAQAYLQMEVSVLGKETSTHEFSNGTSETVTVGSDETHSRLELLFCAHHAAEHVDKAKIHPAVTRIFDHRPALGAQNAAFKNGQ